ncbi:MAG: low specificity L-threonine aldolase [Cytophagales bacterium]|nr:low specificity L-threonine aldolase [Cytophagales bacterium]
MNKVKTLASDNYAGALPEIIQSIIEANTGHAGSYGGDDFTRKSRELFRHHFGDVADVRFVFNGSGANVLSLSTAVEPFSSILCADCSHLYVDESTSPESFTGCRLIPLQTNSEGKIEIEAIKEKIIRVGDEHHPQARVLSITQPTEYGTLYSLKEIRAISDLLKEHHMFLHMDGARIFNAATALNCTLKALTSEAGVDIVSVGGTKIGMLFGEAVVVFNHQLAKNLKFKHKRAMQLASKNRFIACQFEALLKDKLWYKHAKKANDMAALLHGSIKAIPGITVTKPVQANAVFAIIPKSWTEKLQDNLFFYVWNELTNEVRLMCAFDTDENDIRKFVEAIKVFT